MARNDDDAQMRAQLALIQLEEAERDENGNILDRPYEAHRLHLSGMTWKQIAKRVGYTTEQAAHRAATVYLQTAAAQRTKEQREQSLQLQLSRLDALLNTYWNAALLGDVDGANFCLKLIQEMNKLLALYEDSAEGQVTKFVVIQRERGKYVDQLKEIALSPEPKEITTSDEQNSTAEGDV